MSRTVTGTVASLQVDAVSEHTPALLNGDCGSHPELAVGFADLALLHIREMACDHVLARLEIEGHPGSGTRHGSKCIGRLFLAPFLEDEHLVVLFALIGERKRMGT